MRWPTGRGDDRIEERRRALRAHPCHDCPDREDHARWAERWFKLRRDADTLARRVESRTNTVARQFDRVCDVLTALGYLEDGPQDGTVTPLGRPLMRLYSELDLVAAESRGGGGGGARRPPPPPPARAPPPPRRPAPRRGP